MPNLPTKEPEKFVDKQKFFNLIGYEPHTKQRLFHASTARFKLPVCGRRFGKSQMAAKEAEPLLMIPKKRIWIVGPTYELGEKEFRVIWDDMIIKLQLGKERKVKKAFNKRNGDMFIEMPWQTRVEVRSAERPETLVGDGLDYVIMSEAAKHSRETWERFIFPALADHRGHAIFPTTPNGQNWIYDLWQLGQNPASVFRDYDSWRFPSWENPHVYPGGENDPEIQLQKQIMSNEYFLQEIAADFTSFYGKIYSEFDEVTHVKKCTFNPAWPNYIAFDWGYNSPMAAIEFQVDPMGRVHVWREKYQSNTRLETYLEEMKMRDQPSGYRIDLCFGDAADPEATKTVCVKFAPCVSKPESKTNWREGVELVKGFLKEQQVGEEDEYGTPRNEPSLYVDHTCHNTIREFNNYRADAPATRAGKDRNPREAAQAWDDHSLDALRYGLMHIFKLGVTMKLSDVVNTSEFKDIPDAGYFTTNKSFA